MLYLILMTLGFFSIGQSQTLLGKVVGGKGVDISIHPYLAAVLYYGDHICSGTIISKDFVLTVAHCVHRIGSELSISAGSSFINQGGVVINVKKEYPHPNFDIFELFFDVTLLELETSLSFNNFLKPIAIAKYMPAESINATTIGWASVLEKKTKNGHLRSLEVELVNKKVCSKYYLGHIIFELMVCARVKDGSDTDCQNDSGGPLIVDNQLIGITSWANGCNNGPVVFANMITLKSHVMKVTGLAI